MLPWLPELRSFWGLQRCQYWWSCLGVSPREPWGWWLSRPAARVCSSPALWCQMGQVSLGCRWGGQECPHGAGMEETWGADVGGDGSCHACAGVRMGAPPPPPPPGADSFTGVPGVRCCPMAMLTAAPGPKVPSCVTTVLPQASRGCLLGCFEDGSAPTQLMGFFLLGATARDRGGPHPGRHGWCRHQSPSHPLLPPWDHRASQRGHTAPHTPHSDRSRAGEPRAPELPPPHSTGSRGCGRARSVAQPQLQPSAFPGFGAQDRDVLQVPPPKPALTLLSLSRWLALSDL